MQSNMLFLPRQVGGMRNPMGNYRVGGPPQWYRCRGLTWGWVRLYCMSGLASPCFFSHSYNDLATDNPLLIIVLLDFTFWSWQFYSYILIVILGQSLYCWLYRLTELDPWFFWLVSSPNRSWWYPHDPPVISFDGLMRKQTNSYIVSILSLVNKQHPQLANFPILLPDGCLNAHFCWL